MEVEVHSFPYKSPKSLLSRRPSGEMDFHDVFGGPPRRFSMQEVRGRYNLSVETVREEEGEEEDRGASTTPVFGEETTPRRRHRGGNFFDDIFGGDESHASPRNRDRNNPFVSSPKSTSSSPSKHRSEQFSGISSPAAKSNKIEFPAYKLDISTNALISPRTPLSRFSMQDEVRSEVCLYRQSTLPCESGFKIEDLHTNEKEMSTNSKKERKSFDGSSSNQFYRSLYRWASGRSIPMMNLIGRNNSKKDGVGRCASFNGRAENKPSTFGNGSLFVNTEPEEHLETESELKEGRNSVQDVVLDTDADDFSVEVQPSPKSGRSTLSRAKSNIKERIVKEVLLQMDESPRSEIMPTLCSLLIAEAEQKGTEEIKATTSRKDQAGPSKSSMISVEETVAIGKVKEFVQIFNQEADARNKNAQNNASKWKEKVGENPKNDDPEPQPTKIQKIPTTESDHFAPIHNMASSSDSSPWDSTSFENSENSIEDNFMVEQLSKDVTGGNEGLEDIKAIDKKIQEWSMDKRGNIRSLLSTLQYVLWPGSGWRPIPLVELIEANSVKRAYQKALLRLHPDKLQQNSSASHHKYTAEKIFDILQEAWDHFNNVAPL